VAASVDHRGPRGESFEYAVNMTRPDIRVALELSGRDSNQLQAWRGQRPVRVEIDDGWVKWDYLYIEGDYGPGEPEAQFGFPAIPTAPPVEERQVALTEFLSLADKPPDSIRQFVATWGPLHLCSHDLPMTHVPLEFDPDPRNGLFCAYVEGDATWGRERIDAIRGWSRLGLATLRIGIELDADEEARGSESDWLILSKSRPPETHAKALERFTAALNAWLILGLVWATADLSGSPRFLLTAHGVFGVIARQLVSAVVNASVALCVSCGEAYTPKRRPRAGEDSYCERPVCKRVSRREASRRRRQRKRDFIGAARLGSPQ
jgi:hypothetical protein